MDIRFNPVISVAVAIVFVVTSANANNVPQNPVANNQSGPAKPSTKLSSNRIYFPDSHIEAPQKSTAVTTVNTTTVTSTYINTTTTPTKETATAMTSIEVTVATIGNIETTTENQTDENGSLINRFIVKPIRNDGPSRNLCPKGYVMLPNGDCKPIFSDS
ncbi:PREDICTED: uncharacterized protein LOC107169193 [Diuraphis noxia]|uniref:uncharacterized protein LOC107169193 n=1 Tax=Diuraphis noxia TaxID=143948 RepID=UPI0007635632|nr:PREDICTED: uncharacterized protein LOC107169193 [Diuraphis noxia]